MSAPSPRDESIDLPAIPSLTVAHVDPQRMKTMAALLRDPYPIHWDPASVADEAHGGRTVNQGPLNLAYVANMLMAWAGDTSIRKLTASFHAHVLAGDTVTASGEVQEVLEIDGERRARCAVRLVRGSDLIVSGQAEVSLDMLDQQRPPRGEPAGLEASGEAEL